MKNGIEREYVIEEITDTVRYFIENKDAYHVDPDNIFIMGYSAGGFYAAASTLELQRSGIAVKGQILCYAFINGVDEEFITLTEQEKAAMTPALFVVAKGDPLGEGSLAYEKLLHEAGVLTDTVIYDGVKHASSRKTIPNTKSCMIKTRRANPKKRKRLQERQKTLSKNGFLRFIEKQLRNRREHPIFFSDDIHFSFKSEYFLNRIMYCVRRIIILRFDNKNNLKL